MKKRHDWPLLTSQTPRPQKTPPASDGIKGVSKVYKRWLTKGDQHLTKFLEDRAPKKEALLRDISNFKKGIYTA
jgi:hypothetical protein